MDEVRRKADRAIVKYEQLGRRVMGKERPKSVVWPALALALVSTAGAAVARRIARRYDSAGARITAGAATFEATASWVYLLAVRPWLIRWGATDEEITKPLPGDEVVPSPRYETTHAITINAPVNKVWPWIVQMGQGRGGMYSYDWLENLADLDIHSTDRIIPELQDLKAGDTIPLAPEFGIPVVAIEPERALVLGGAFDPSTMEGVNPRDPETERYWNAGWVFVLDPLDENTTRLVVRFRVDYKPSVPLGFTVQLPLEPIHFIMERKMLLGIKERAERIT